jgi:hypothetical protein
MERQVEDLLEAVGEWKRLYSSPGSSEKDDALAFTRLEVFARYMDVLRAQGRDSEPSHSPLAPERAVEAVALLTEAKKWLDNECPHACNDAGYALVPRIDSFLSHPAPARGSLRDVERILDDAGVPRSGAPVADLGTDRDKGPILTVAERVALLVKGERDAIHRLTAHQIVSDPDAWRDIDGLFQELEAIHCPRVNAEVKVKDGLPCFFCGEPMPGHADFCNWRIMREQLEYARRALDRIKAAWAEAHETEVRQIAADDRDARIAARVQATEAQGGDHAGPQIGPSPVEIT